MMTDLRRMGWGAAVLLLLTVACSNSPYPLGDIASSTAFKAFDEPPKYLDPVKSYYSYEAQIIDQVYEFPFEYHYLKRPYTLTPCLAEAVPASRTGPVTLREAFEPRRFDARGNEAWRETTVTAVSYVVRLKKGVYYQPHPCFPTNGKLGARTREMTADDFLYSFKRMADPKLACPVFPTLAEKIRGFEEFYAYNAGQTVTVRTGETLASIAARFYGDAARAKLLSKLNNGIADRDLKPGTTVLKVLKPTDYSYPLSGIIVRDRYTFEVVLKQAYPLILNWMAMHFTSPVPAEAVAYYKKAEGFDALPEEVRLSQPFYLPRPVGTGPYMLTRYEPRRMIVLERNPLYRGEPYPSDGSQADREKGLLDDAGKRMPFIDRIVFAYYPEYITTWNLFRQGYLDASGIGKEHFDKVITDKGELSAEMRGRGIRLETAVSSDIYYYGFNMADPTVGGTSERKRLLRQAISCAVDMATYKRIFYNDRGLVPQSPVPPGIFGYRDRVPSHFGFDPGRAKALLAKAGYKDGIDPATGQPLEIRYDTTVSAGASSGSRPQLQYLQEQFERAGLRLKIVSSDLNTYRRKIYDGNYQMFSLGWLPDYPDPENFLFLLYGPNANVPNHGENLANYRSAEYDLLFDRMKAMENTPARLAIIHRMEDIVNTDCPWIYMLHSEEFSLFHSWYRNIVTTDIINNHMKYKRIVPELRMAYVKSHNRPVYWPVLLLLMALAVSLVPAAVSIRRRYK
jgi:ABC-type transport system substrate-binding protein